MRKLFWILLIAVILFLVAYGVYDPLKATVNDLALSWGGQAAVGLSAFWSGVSANPIYQQYHMVLWLVAGGILVYAVPKLWKKRPAIMRKAQPQVTPAKEYQQQMANPELYAETQIETKPQASPPKAPVKVEEKAVEATEPTV